MTDLELLREYAETGNEEAFAQIVRLHVDMVYSTAHRQLRNATLAEDVTQRVFIVLACKAAKLKREVLLGGWLYNAAVLASHDARRTESRRSKREEKAAHMARQTRDSMATEAKASDADWSSAESVLDEAMAKLRPSTRGLLVATFWEGKTAREVGERLGISEEAVRKRVSRAVDELREIFARKGVALTSAGVTEALAVQSALKAPAGLAASSASAASAATAGTGSAGIISSGAIIMAATKAKVAVAVLIGALVIGGGVVGTVKVIHSFSSPTGSRIISLTPPGPMVSGTIHGPDGKPIADAEVLVGYSGHSASGFSSRPRRANAPPEADAASDASGKFSVHQPDPPFLLVIRSPSGYAEVTSEQLKTSSDIKLQPWGRIEGVVKAGDKVLPKTKVRLWRVQEQADPALPLIHVETELTSDASGRYVVPNVPPGEMWVYRILPGGMMRSADWQYVQVESGKVSNVTIGGVGRSVVGRIDVPPALADFCNFQGKGTHLYDAAVRLQSQDPRGPKHAAGETPEQYAAAEMAFGRTEEGRRSKQWMFGSAFTVEPDGSFRIDNLPPGKFELTVRNFEENSEVNFLEDVGRTASTFEIPVDSSGPGAPPINVGTLTVQSVSRIRPGTVAPDFTVTTLDGQTWRYADHKGKPVVFVFWGGWDNDASRIKEYGEFSRKWASDPRISILGVFVTDKLDHAKKLIAEVGMTFPQTSEGEKLMPLFGSSWPEAIVISRDGIIMQKHLHEKVLEKYIQKALGGGPAAATAPANH